MEFTIEFYETSSGRSPVREFLDDLKKSDPDELAIIMAGLTKLRNRDYHKSPLSRPIGDDFFESRHVGQLNTRVLYFFVKGQRIILVHGIRKKTRTLPVRDREVALERKRGWLARHPT